MEMIRLGKTEMMVSRLGLGGIPIQRVSEDEAVAVVKRCLELGINYIDTANAYTNSEERIGKAISGRREGVFIATKTQSRTREGAETHLKLSLKQLAVESIDLYQFHNVADSDSFERILAPDGALAAVEEAKRAGVVKHIGVTSHSLDMAKELVKSDRFETIMFPFNFITCEAADELLPLCREHDVGYIVMKPLAGGMLDNITIAFKYLFQFPDIVPIPGIEKIEEIEEIVQVLEGPWQMTEAEQSQMQRLREELGTRFCRRCDYCQPCTEEIPIATVMTSGSFARRLPPERLFSGMLAEALEKAAYCTACGLCEPKCPYGLPIIDIIAERAEWYQVEKREYQKRVTARSN
ncbi:MAG: aldo/keto reductase [Chloroflexi bacterium]|nr:aldo/keto reductase [Chloroflexota bacterium]